MKGIRKIAIWAILSIMMQVAGLLYLDKVVFKYSSEFKVVKPTNVVKNKEIKYSIPTDAQETSVSDDGKYITYVQNGKLMLVNTSTLEVQEIITNQAELLKYKWILDEDILMVAEKVSTGTSTSVIRLETYNVKNGYETKMSDLCTYRKGMVVDNVASSFGTGTHYIGVSRDGYNSSIYRVNINFSCSTVGYSISELGAMQAVENSDILLYEDALNKRFYYYTNGKSMKVNFADANNLTLVGVDDNKNVYMGEVQDEKVTKIMYGVYNTDPSTWKTINLEKSKDLKDIIITEDNQLLVNDNLTGKVTNLTTNKSMEYEGKLLQITSQYLVSIDGDKIVFKELKK